MRLLPFLVVLLRILGGFPFSRVRTEPAERTWVRHSDQEQVNSTKFPLYRRSRFWVLWTSVVYVTVLTYNMAYVVLWYTFGEEIFQVITLGIANIVKDLIQMLSITSVLTYLMLKKSLAQELISELQTTLGYGGATHETRRRSPFSTAMLMLYLACSVLVVGLYTATMLREPALVAFITIFGASVSILIYGFTMSFYFVAISGLSEAYDEIATKLSQLMSPQSVHRSRQVNWSGTASISMSTVAAEEIVRDASETLLRLQHHLLLLHRYIAFPITMVMQMCVSATILNFFFITFWMVHTWERKLLLIAYMITVGLPILVLCNVPQILENRVRHLQNFIRSLLRSNFSQRQEKLLRDLLDILQESPDFKMCGLFTLDRARLVEIFSFMATYFIILLQFRISEGLDKEGFAGGIQEG